MSLETLNWYAKKMLAAIISSTISAVAYSIISCCVVYTTSKVILYVLFGVNIL